MIRVSSKSEAWEVANRFFPTDYMRDDVRSKNAGYDIYFSTADGVNAWISDLNDRLELNYPNGSSENIWIAQNEMTFRKIVMTADQGTQITAVVTMYGMKFSTTHYPEYYLDMKDEEFDSLAEKTVTDMRVVDGVLEVMLK
jgi:hypothetical protein